MSRVVMGMGGRDEGCSGGLWEDLELVVVEDDLCIGDASREL